MCGQSVHKLGLLLNSGTITAGKTKQIKWMKRNMKQVQLSVRFMDGWVQITVLFKGKRDADFIDEN